MTRQTSNDYSMIPRAWKLYTGCGTHETANENRFEVFNILKV